MNERDATAELTDAALLDRGGVMRAIWWSRCPACSGLIHGGQHCSCGQAHLGDVQGITAVDGRRAWVCRPCLLKLTPADAGPAVIQEIR